MENQDALQQLLLAPGDSGAQPAAPADAGPASQTDDLQNLLLSAPDKVARSQSQPSKPSPPAKPKLKNTDDIGLADMVVRGITGTGSDYIGAAGNVTANKLAGAFGSSVPPLSFNDSLQQQQQSAEAYVQEHPIAARAAEITGGIVSPVFNGVAAGVGRVLSSLPRYLQYGAQGLGVGTTSGILSARDQSGGAPTTADIGKNALAQGTLGSAMGIAIPGATELGAKAFNLMRGAPALMDAAGNAVSGVTQAAIDRITKAMGRDNLLAPTNPILPSPAGSALSPLGPQGTLADTGPNMSLAVERAASRPGAALTTASNFAAARQSGAPERVMGSITDNLTDPNFYETIDALRAQRNATAQPLRQQAFDESAGQPIKSPLIQRLQGTPEFQSAMGTGKSIARMEAARTGQDIPLTETWFHEPDPTPQTWGEFQRGENMPGQEQPEGLSNPSVTIQSEPTLRMLDAAKQGYNEMLRPYRNPYTGELQNLSPKGVEIAKTVEDLTGELRANSDTYSQYLDSWADPSQSMQAVKTGKAFLTMKPQEASRIWNGMTDTEQQFAKVGFAKAQVDKVGDVSKGGNPAGRLLATPNQESVAQMIYGDDFPQFQQDMQNEATFAQNNQNWTKNSRTAIRSNPEDDESNTGKSLLGAAGHAVSGNWLGAATHLAGPAIDRAKGMIMNLFGPGEAVSSELTNRLLSQDPAVQSQTLDLVNRLAATRAQRAASPASAAIKSQSLIPGTLSTMGNYHLDIVRHQG